MVVVDEEGRHAMEASDKSKTEGIIIMLTAVPEPPEVEGVKLAPETGKESLRRTASTVAGRVIERASADSDKSGSRSSRTEQGDQQWSHYAPEL